MQTFCTCYSIYISVIITIIITMAISMVYFINEIKKTNANDELEGNLCSIISLKNLKK